MAPYDYNGYIYGASEPNPQDPRFSKDTPDKIVANIVSKRSGAEVIGDSTSWAASIMAGKAKKFARIDPKRKKLVALLEQMAEIEETNAVEIDSKVNMVSPAPARLERASETRVVLVRHGGDLRAATSANAFVSPVRWMA